MKRNILNPRKMNLQSQRKRRKILQKSRKK